MRELLNPAALFFSANVKGWQTIYAIPFSGAHANRVLEVLCSHDWESSESPVGYATNVRNGWPNELVVHFNSHEQLKLKNVIEFMNAAKIHFLKRLLQPDAAPSSNLLRANSLDMRARTNPSQTGICTYMLPLR